MKNAATCLQLPNLGRLLFTGITGFTAALGLANLAAASNITPGNIAVLRIGDGITVLSSTSAPSYIDEYTPAGTLVQSIPLPVVAAGTNLPYSNSGTATSEGFLTQSVDGNYLVAGGYGAIPGTASIAVSASVTIPRVVARIDLAGNVDTSTALSDAYSGGNIRSVCSTNGIDLWTGGTASSSGSVRYATLGATTSTQLATAPSNVRVVGIDAGQLYFSAASSTFFGVATMGTGLPTTNLQTAVLLTGFPTTTGPSSYDYFFADPTTLYVADDRATAAGGIQKWTLVAGTWTLQYTLSPALNVGCRGLSGVVNGGVTTLYASTSQSSLNTLVSVVDTGVASTFTTVATAATNMIFRGVRLVKSNTPPAPGTPFCIGDGTGTACPCANSGAAGNGCANSLNPSGGNLAATGSASVALDTLVLTGSGVPNGPGLYFQGTTQLGLGNGVLFGDGLRCIGGSIIRLGIVGAAANTSTYPSPNPPVANAIPISVKGFCASGDIRNYQLWYRDSGVFCTAAVFNLTNAINVVWQP